MAATAPLLPAIATVVGIVDTGIADIDRVVAQVPLAWFQDVFTMGDHGHAVVVRLPELDTVPTAVEHRAGPA